MFWLFLWSVLWRAVDLDRCGLVPGCICAKVLGASPQLPNLKSVLNSVSPRLRV
jgi:hypothetical protein